MNEQRRPGITETALLPATNGTAASLALTAFDRLVDALESSGRTVRSDGHIRAQAQCPAHADLRPSLSITATGSRTLVHCHAGCDTQDVLAAVGLTLADLYDQPFQHKRYGQVYAKYMYPDGREVLRTADKQFPQPQQAKNKGRRLFHDDKIGKATEVYVVEGEEDVFAVEAAGGVAVCSAMGAGKADKFDWTPLRGRDVRIIADNDEPGRNHAAQVADQLDGIARSVRIVLPVVGKDASDHVAAGKVLTDLVEFQEPSLLDTHARNGAWLEVQTFPKLEYAVDGIIPEGTGLLVAPPKKGKSFLVGNIGLAAARGGKALGCITVVQRPVLYLALEDGYRRLQDRFHRILGGDEMIPAGIEIVIDATPNEALLMIAEFLARHRDAKPLVILDTLGKIKPPRRMGEESYVADYALGSTLKKLADAAPGSTLLVVHHTRKAEALDFVDSVSGTQGIAGSVDFILALNRKRHSDDAVLSVTGRDVIEAEYAMHADEGILWRLDGAGLQAARDAVDERQAAEKVGDRMMDVYLEVRAAKGTPVSAVEVAGALGDMDNDTAGQYLRRLAAKNYISKYKRGLYVVSEVAELSELALPARSVPERDSDSDHPAVSELSGKVHRQVPAASPAPSRSDSSDSSYTSDTSNTSDGTTKRHITQCRCECGCDHELSHPLSIERGYCEGCRLRCKPRQGGS